MKRLSLSILVFILISALCVPFTVKGETEETETSAASETVQETEIIPEETQEPEVPEDETEEIQDEPGTSEDINEQETEEPEPAEEPSEESEEPADDPSEELQIIETPEENEPETPEEDTEETDLEILEEEPEEETPEEEKKDPEKETPEKDKEESEKEPFEFEEDEEEKEKQQELNEARAENKNSDNIVPVANSIWIETVAHFCNGHLLSAEKYGRFQGLTDFTFFTAQESGSYSAYTAGGGLIVLGKYQFTDFGSQGNGTATALVAYMRANCSGAADLYEALYQAFVAEKRNAVSEWNACALNDTEQFMALQDQFAYEHYYVRGEAAVEAAGISLKDRPWIVKGMCFSIFNALGPYNEYGSGAYAITTAGIQEDDSNAVFIRKICANMVSLYADRYTWMYGRYCDGSDTALGISDRDLALEILSGSLYLEKEPVTDKMLKVTIKDPSQKVAKKTGIYVKNIRVTAQSVREYTNETEKKVLKASKDYTVSSKVNKKHTKLTITIIGKGIYEGQTLKKTIPLSAVQSDEQ